MGEKNKRKGKESSPLPSFGLAEDVLGAEFPKEKKEKKVAEEVKEKEDNLGLGFLKEKKAAKEVKEEDILVADFLKEEKKAVKENDKRLGGGNRGFQDDALMKFVTFFLENEEYGLPISKVQEIKRIGEITRVPNAPEHVKGVMNLRGKIVPVIELKKRLQIGEALIDKDSRIVVVEQGLKILGLMVDRVAQVLNITAEQIDNAPEEVVQVEENYIRGVGKIDERMIILLDLEQIIGKEVGA